MDSLCKYMHDLALHKKWSHPYIHTHAITFVVLQKKGNERHCIHVRKLGSGLGLVYAKY